MLPGVWGGGLRQGSGVRRAARVVFLGVRGGELGVGRYVYAGYAWVRVIVSIRRSGRRLGGRYCQISGANISVQPAGNARPLALPMGELARLKAVTERVPGRNHRIYPNLPLPAPSQSRFARQLSHRESQGAAAPPGCFSYGKNNVGAVRRQCSTTILYCIDLVWR